MDDGRDPDPDDVSALEAVWGREASATAAGAPPPAVDLVVDRTRPPAVPPAVPPAGSPAATVGGARHRRRGLLVVGAAVAVVGLVAGGLVLLGGDGDDGSGGGDAPTTAASAGTTPATATLDPPAWAAPVSCPTSEGGEETTTSCPVALDEERAYVLALVDGMPTVRALEIDGGGVMWELAMPAGASDLVRLPGAVLVVGVGAASESVAIDPFTGTERWRRPGAYVAALGPDRVLLDAEVSTGDSWTSTMRVVDVASGEVVLERTGPSDQLYLHPCGAAGLVVAYEAGVLTAYRASDGRVRWTAEVAPTTWADPVRCDASTVAFVDGSALRLLEVATGVERGAVAVTGGSADPTAEVLAVAGGAVAVGTPDAVRVHRAATDAAPWVRRCLTCGREIQVAPAGDDLVVVLPDEVLLHRTTGDGDEPSFGLAGRGSVALTDEVVVSWNADGVLVADTDGLVRRGRVVLADVRSAAADHDHLVVATATELRAYPREG